MPLKDCLTSIKQFKPNEIDAYLAKKEKYLKQGMSEKEAELRVVGEAIDSVNSNMKAVYDQLGMKVQDATKELSERLPQLSQRLAGMNPEDVRQVLRKSTNLDESYIDSFVSGIPKAKKEEVSANEILNVLDANKESFSGPLGEMVAAKLNDPSERNDIVEMVKMQANDDPEAAAKVYGQAVVDAVLGVKPKETVAKTVKESDKKQEKLTRGEFLKKMNDEKTGDFALITQLSGDNKQKKISAIISKIEKAWDDGVITDDDYENLMFRAANATQELESKYKPKTTKAEEQAKEAPVKEEDPVEAEKPIKEDKKGLWKRVAALEDMVNPVDRVLQYFANGGKISPAAIKELFGSASKSYKAEFDARIGLTSKKSPSIDGLAHDLWEADETGKFTTQDFKDAIEQALTSHNSRAQMAKSLLERYEENNTMADLSESEMEALGDAMGYSAEWANMEENRRRLLAQLEEMVSAMPESVQSELIGLLSKYQDQYGFIDWEKLAEDNGGFDPDILSLSPETNKYLYEIIQQNTRQEQNESQNSVSENDRSQTIEEKNVQAELDQAVSELKAATDAMKQKRSQLEKEFQKDQEDLFGNRQTASGLFDVRAEGSAIESAMKPFQDRVEKAKQEVDRLSKKLSSVTGKPSSQLDFLAKLATGEDAIGENVEDNFGEDTEAAFDELEKVNEGDPQMLKAVKFIRSLVQKIGGVKVVMLDNFDGNDHEGNPIDKRYQYALGLAMPDGTVLLNYSLLKNNRQEALNTFFHEMVHAVTRKEINSNKALKEELTALTDSLREALGLPDNARLFSILYESGLINKDLYGTQNPHELMAEVFSNKKFYDYLKTIKYKGDSFLVRVYQKILSFFSKSYKNLVDFKSQVDVDNVADYLMEVSDRFFTGQQAVSNDTLPMLSQNTSEETDLFVQAAAMIEAGSSIDEAINMTVNTLATQMQGEKFSKRELKRVVQNRFKEIGLITEDKNINYRKAIDSLFPKPDVKGIKQAYRKAFADMQKGAKEVQSNQEFIVKYLKDSGVNLSQKRMNKVMDIVTKLGTTINVSDKLYKALEDIDAIIQEQAQESQDIKEQENTRRMTEAIKQKFRDRFMKEKAMKQGERNQATLTKELLSLATAYFKANGIDLTQRRIVAIMKQISKLSTVDATVDLFEKVLENMDATILQQKNQNNIKAFKDALKKIKKIAKGTNIQDVDRNFLRALNFPAAMKVLRLMGPQKLEEYVNIVNSVALAYSTKQGIRFMSKDRVKWFIETLNKELGEVEQKNLENLLEMAKQAGEVGQDTTIEDYLPILYNNQKEGLTDYLKTVVKELQSMLTGDYGENDSVAKELAELSLDNFDSDGLKKLNNILNNIINDDDFDGSEAILAKYKDANNSLTEMEKPANALKIRQLNAWKDFTGQKVADLKTMTNMITSLFYDDKARAKFRELLFGRLDRMLSKPRAEINDLAKQVADLYKKYKFDQMSDHKLSAYAFLNQYLNNQAEEFGERLNKLIDDNIVSLYNTGMIKGDSPNKKVFMQSAENLAKALVEMDLIDGYEITDSGIEVSKKDNVSFEDLQKSLTENEMEMYKFARSKFDEIVDRAEQVARNVYGIDFTRWNNYFPMIARKMKEADTATGDLETVQDNFEIYSDAPNKLSKKPTDRLKERTKLAGSDKYYQMGFIDMFLNGYSQTLISNYAARDLVALAGVANSDRFGKFLSGAVNEIVAGTKDDFQENKRVFREKLADVVADKLQAPFLFKNRDEFLKKGLRSTMNYVVKTWLARVDQFVLQYAPNWGAAAVELGVPAMARATMIQINSAYDKDLREDYNKFMRNTTGQFRSALGMEAFDETMKQFDKPGWFTTASNILNIPSMPGSFALHAADKGANNATLLAAYIKYLVDNKLIEKPSDFDLESHAEFPNPSALAYAEQIAARVNNESDKANRANVIKNKNGTWLSFMWLLKGYNLNAYQEAASNMKVVVSKRSSSIERAEAMRHVMSYTTQIFIFNALKAAVIAPAYVAIAQYVLPAVLGVEPPEEDEATKKANREKKQVKFAASLFADLTMGGLPQVGEEAAKKGMNWMYQEAMNQLREQEKTGMYDPKLNPYYISPGEIGNSALVLDAVEKVKDAFADNKQTRITEEARQAKDKVDIAQLIALALRSGDLLRLTNAVDSELSKVKKQKKSRKSSGFGGGFSGGFGGSGFKQGFK